MVSSQSNVNITATASNKKGRIGRDAARAENLNDLVFNENIIHDRLAKDNASPEIIGEFMDEDRRDEEAERFAVMTEDGGLHPEEALAQLGYGVDGDPHLADVANDNETDDVDAGNQSNDALGDFAFAQVLNALTAHAEAQREAAQIVTDETQVEKNRARAARIKKSAPDEAERLNKTADTLQKRIAARKKKLEVERTKLDEIPVEIDRAAINGTITEDSLASIFTTHCGARFRCEDAEAWYHWDGTRWRANSHGQARHDMRLISRALNPGGANPTLGRASTTKGALSFAAADPAIFVSSSDQIWDRDAYLLGTPGGTVDLKTGFLRPARPSEYITQQTKIAPSDNANCPRWSRFITEVADGDEQLHRYLQQIAGCFLTGDARNQLIFFIWGASGTGKGTFMRSLAGILGDYYKNAPMSFFLKRKFDPHPTDLARLKTARMVTASETGEGETWDEAKLKTLSGGDTQTAHSMAKDPFEFKPKFKLVFSSNQKPSLRVVDDAIKRRLILIPFMHKPIKVNLNLDNEFAQEYEGILRWAIEGCLDWQEYGFVVPDVVKQQTDEYFSEQDRRGQWFDDCLEIGVGAFTSNGSLYESWTNYSGKMSGSLQALTTWIVDVANNTLTKNAKFTKGKSLGERGIFGLRLTDKERAAQRKRMDEVEHRKLAEQIAAEKIIAENE